MPVLYPIWSDAFHALSVFAKRKNEAALDGFIHEFDMFIEYWKTQPPTNEVVQTATLKIPIPATREEELDELLIYSVQSCPQKSKMLLEAGASVNASTLYHKKRAILWVAKFGNASLMRQFFEDETLWEMKYMGVGSLKARNDELLEEYSSSYAFAAVLDAAILHNSLDMVKVITDKVNIAKCIAFDEKWAQTSDRLDGPLKQHTTAIVRAITSDKADIVEYLVDKGYKINSKATKDRLSVSNCVRCTNRNCYPPNKNTSTNTSSSHRTLNDIIWDSAQFAGDVWPRQQVTIAQTSMPRIFASCNMVMFDLLVRLGADMKIENHNVKICPRGIHEYESAIMDERRLAFSMVLNARLGSSSIARCLDEEVTRIVLSEATPCVALEDL